MVSSTDLWTSQTHCIFSSFGMVSSTDLTVCHDPVVYLHPLKLFHRLTSFGCHDPIVEPLPNSQFETLPNQKGLQMAIFNLMKIANFSKFSKKVDNTVGKGEIARYKQFLLFPWCFQKTILQTCKNQGLLRKRLISSYEGIILRTPDKRELSLFQTTNFIDSSKLKEFADNNFKFDENGRKFSTRVENTGKGEIARYEQFLLFPHYFQKI